ncbi:MAG: hypothetical protein LBI10_03310 [Deltaproteobacteria bacterium]|nr:hypothetical protein [Deltaproteobacteria bacterium]
MTKTTRSTLLRPLTPFLGKNPLAPLSPFLLSGSPCNYATRLLAYAAPLSPKAAPFVTTRFAFYLTNSPFD